MMDALKHLMRGLLLLLAVVALVSLLAGCGGGDPEPDVLLPHVSCTAGVCK